MRKERLACEKERVRLFTGQKQSLQQSMKKGSFLFLTFSLLSLVRSRFVLDCWKVKSLISLYSLHTHTHAKTKQEKP